MVISELEIGTKLELELLDKDGVSVEPTLVSELEGITGDHEAIIAAPIFGGNIYPLRIGTGFNAYFTVGKETELQLYRFRAVVRNRVTSGNLHFLNITALREPEKVQRRNYYRLNCSVRVRYRFLDSHESADDRETPFMTTVTVNISGGGICLRIEEKIDIGRLVECVVETDADRKISFIGKVVRCEKSEIESKYRYEAGIDYTRIDDKEREAVVRYIFEEQRKLRKKGLI